MFTKEHHDFYMDLYDADEIGLLNSIAPSPAEDPQESAAEISDAHPKTETHREAGAIPIDYFKCHENT